MAFCRGWLRSHFKTSPRLTLRVLEVMPPKWPDLVLTTDIPHGETDVLVLYCLHIKTCASKNNIYLDLVLNSVCGHLAKTWV